MISKKNNIKFKKILNDLKRRPEDAASDLGVTKKKFKTYWTGKKLEFDLIEKAVDKWPVNYNEFFLQDDTKNGYKILKIKPQILQKERCIEQDIHIIYIKIR